jgi:serine/threonine protein kinase
MRNYRVIREIGRGGIGVVYLAQSTSDATEFRAVKELDFEQLDPQSREGAFREIKIVQSLHHMNIVKIYARRWSIANSIFSWNTRMRATFMT